jgi:hypothetical protein
MVFLVWAFLWTSAFFPSSGIAALRDASSAIYSTTYAPPLDLSPARQVGQPPLISEAPEAKRLEFTALGAFV